MEWAADGMPVRLRLGAEALDLLRRRWAETAQPRGFRTKIWMAWAVSASARSNARGDSAGDALMGAQDHAGHLIHQPNPRPPWAAGTDRGDGAAR